jgi:hypothetical protein
MDFFFFIQNNNLRMSLNFIQSRYVTEDMCRIYISKMFVKTYSTINNILEESKSVIIKGDCDEEKTVFIIELTERRIIVILNKFEDLLLTFNYRFKQNLEVPPEIFGHEDKIATLLISGGKQSNIDMDSID